MSGKPRKKKGETQQHHRERVKAWIEDQARPLRQKIMRQGKEMFTTEKEWDKNYRGVKAYLEITPAEVKNCHTCALYVPVIPRNTWGECARDPIWLRVSDNHYCGSWRAWI